MTNDLIWVSHNWREYSYDHLKVNQNVIQDYIMIIVWPVNSPSFIDSRGIEWSICERRVLSADTSDIYSSHQCCNVEMPSRLHRIEGCLVLGKNSTSACSRAFTGYWRARYSLMSVSPPHALYWVIYAVCATMEIMRGVHKTSTGPNYWSENVYKQDTARHIRPDHINVFFNL